MTLSTAVHPLNERLFKLEAAIEDNDTRVRALTASLDRVCLPLNLKKLKDTKAPDYAKTRNLVRDVIRSHAAVRATARRLKREYDALLIQANNLPSP